MDLETLMLDTLDAVSRFRVGQREAIDAALDAGLLLAQAKGMLPHGGWGEWLDRVGLAARTASRWMKLAALDLTPEEVIANGGIDATLKGKRKSATVADLSMSTLAQDLAAAEREIARTKLDYYEALNTRHRALRALAKGGDDAKLG